MDIGTQNLIELLQQEQRRFIGATRAENTLRAYRYDWAGFSAWCESAELSALPALPETPALYLTDLLKHKRKISTCERALAAIRHYHRARGLPSPVNDLARAVIAGAKRVLKEKPRQKAALSLEDLKRICSRPAGTPREIRNRAIVLFGFSTALRRAEIARAELADVDFAERGMLVRVKWEKQDQEGQGRSIAVCAGSTPETCPIRALRAWLEVRGYGSGPLFHPFRRGFMLRKLHLRPQVIAEIVQAAVRTVGLDSRAYGAHSLRAGFITAAALAGASEINIARHTGHRSMNVLRRYIRARDPFEGSASGILGL